jgi:hypothetical protein
VTTQRKISMRNSITFRSTKLKLFYEILRYVKLRREDIFKPTFRNDSVYGEIMIRMLD